MYVLVVPITYTHCLRNICARKWKESHPRGTTADFKAYYDNLSAEDRQVFVFFV